MRRGALLTITAALLLLPLPARPTTPAPSLEDRQLSAALQHLAAHVGQPAAMADVLAVARTFGALPPSLLALALAPVQQRWARKVQAARSPAGAVLRSLLETAAWRAGRLDLLAHLPPQPGAVAQLAWLGPFGAEHGSAYARPGEVEREAMNLQGKQPQAHWPGRGGEVAWQPLPQGFAAGTERLALEELVDRPDDAIVYVQAWIRTQHPGPAQLRLGVEGAARAWLDGVRVLDAPGRPALYGLAADVPPLPEVAVAPVVLRPGWQRLLIKLAPDGGALPLSIMLQGAHGEPLEVESQAAFAAPEPLPAPLPALVTPAVPDDRAADLLWREDRKLPRPSPLPALVALAWHDWPLPDALTERLLAALPEELPATPDVALGHALLAGELGDRIDRLRQWLTLLPDSAELMVAQAVTLDEMGKTAAAHRLWDEFAQRTHKPPEEDSIRACVVRVDLWTRLGADLAAAELLRTCAARWPNSPELLAAQVREATAHDRLALAAQLQAELLRLEPGRLERHMALLQAQVQAGDLAGAELEAAEIAQRFPAHDRAPEVMAQYWLAEEQPQRALAALARLPAHLRRTNALELAGRCAARMGDPQKALAILREAVALSPSKAELRTRLQLLRPDGDFFSLHRKDLVALVKAELGQPRKEPLETRLRQTVLQVVGNGKQARYDAEVLYVGKGGDPKHDVEIEYAPTLSRAEVLQAVIVRQDGHIERTASQEVDQLGEDASGMYYDIERITLGFKGLKAGDAVVVEYVVRDLAPTPFGLVFGELLQLGDEHPVRESEVVVQVPEHMPFFYEVADGPKRDAQPSHGVAGTQMTRHSLPRTGSDRDDAGPWDEWHLHLGPLPAAKSEENMPGSTDVVPYLHLSSFANWQAAARWYSGLMAEALPARGADPAVRELAQRLTAHATTTEQKVRAIYAYATQQVRYVGLEFGIHSLKPHAVRDIVQRQFGDCKDKAALVVALCAEVGVEAQLALVRTVDEGRLHDGIASLGVFNHAIAYVPELDWWLDATAQHHAPLELPDGDTGGMALRIPTPRSAVDTPHPGLQTLPTQPAEKHEHREEIDLTLLPDGAALMKVSLRIHGLPAAEVRARLFTAETRKERLEQDYASRFPGIAVTDVQVAGIDPPGDVLEVHLQARVPQLARQQGGGLGWAPLRTPQAYAQSLTPLTTRTWDLVLQHPFREVTLVRLHAPPGLAFVRLPPPANVPWLHGEFTLDARRAPDGTVELETLFTSDARRVLPQEYPAFRAWLTAVDATLRGEVVMGRPAP